MSDLPDGASAPIRFLLPLANLPTYDIADDSGSNCRIWHQFYQAYADLFLREPTKNNADDLRCAHAGLTVALDIAGVPVPRSESNRVRDIIDSLSV